MISRLIGGFVSILLGTVLVDPLSSQVILGGGTTVNSTGGTCTSTNTETRCALYNSATWGATVLKLVPGFFALGILGIGIAVTYGSMRDAGIV